MTLTDAALRALLPDWTFQVVPSIDSTMNAAAEWLRAGAPHLSFITADQQTAGRGRLSRGWQSPPGSALATSFVLRLAASQISQIPMLGGLAVAEALDALGVPDVALKWPNDVLIGTLKISGILAEAHWDGERLLGVVLGMGINVRIDFSGSELETSAISAETALGKPVHRSDLLARVARNLEARWPLVGSPILTRHWEKRLATLGQAVRIEGAEIVEGIAESIDEDGALFVRLSDGTRRRVVAGDVRLRPAIPPAQTD
jgi:BirA family biotin operon repressor/biotin-[acetyl-CoA-carboxylase] ligase